MTAGNLLNQNIELARAELARIAATLKALETDPDRYTDWGIAADAGRIAEQLREV